jgi:hypothetical protein
MNWFNKSKALFGIDPDFPVRKYLFDAEYKKSREFYYWYYKEYKFRNGADINFKENISSDVEIDLYIPSHEKDLDVLPYAIQYAKMNLKHPISSIYVVSPESKPIQDVCKKYGCIYVNEFDVLNFKKSDIDYKINGVDRSGFLCKQLISLQADKVCKKEHILAMDSDTLFIRPRVFEYKGKYILDFSDEFHIPYFQSHERLTGLKHSEPVSYITHFMLYEKKKLRELRQLIENTTGMDFTSSLLKNVDKNEMSYFADFETYPNFVLEKYRSQYVIEYWYNKSYKRNELKDLESIITPELKEHYKTISFHSYNT